MSDDQKKSLYYQAKLKAVENTLNDDDISFYKRVTRWYSTTFATPLQEVRNKIAWPQILQEYYESTMEDTDFNDVYEYAMRDILPEFMEEIEASDEEFAQNLIDEQQQTIKKKKQREMKLKDDTEIEVEEETLKEPTNHETGEKPKPKEIGMSFDEE